VKKAKGESEREERGKERLILCTIYFDTALVATTAATTKDVGGGHITATTKTTTTVLPHNE